jgi:hypothetical protein
MLNNNVKNNKKFATENNKERKFTTFDKNLVEFLQDKGISYVNSFKGKGGDQGFDYEFISNLRDLLYEYRNPSKKQVTRELIDEDKQARFEIMLSNFLKDSIERKRGFVKEHTKAETKQRKDENGKRRKIALAKRNKRRAENNLS